MFGYIVAFGLGYGAARMVDNPARVRSAARAVADEGRRIKTAASEMRGNVAGRTHGRARGSLVGQRRKYEKSYDRLDALVQKHARHPKGVLRPGQKVGALTITAVGTHTVNYKTPDGWGGTIQIPWIGSRGEQLPSHRRALAEANR